MHNLSLHNIVKTETETNESNGTKWTTYKFTDNKGQTFEVTTFHK